MNKEEFEEYIEDKYFSTAYSEDETYRWLYNASILGNDLATLIAKKISNEHMLKQNIHLRQAFHALFVDRLVNKLKKEIEAIDD